MGKMQFLAPERDRVADDAVRGAYIAGLDLIPTPTHLAWQGDNTLVANREINESGNLHIAWHVAGHGRMMLSTASLMERERPYLLPLELARGTLNRLRNQAANWRMAGLQLGEDFTEIIRQNSAEFTRAVMSQQDPPTAASAAEESICLSVGGIADLGARFAEQVLGLRHEQTPELPTLLAGNLGIGAMPDNTEPMFGAAFNTAVCPFTWRAIQPEPDRWEWTVFEKQIRLCHRHGLKVFGGPLLCLDESALPDWILHGEVDFTQLAHQFQQFSMATVKKFHGDVHVWLGASGTNRRGPLQLSDEQRMRLTVQAIECIRQYDPRTPLVVTVDQPWGEYMTNDVTQLPPLHFAETLVRAELGVAGVGLDINMGYQAHGSEVRDIIEFNELIDCWSMLGLPLLISLTAPSSAEDDPRAVDAACHAISDAFPTGPSLAAQKEFVERLLPILLAKQSVHSVIWNEVFDSLSHVHPCSGLFRADDMPKPALSALLNARREHLT